MMYDRSFVVAHYVFVVQTPPFPCIYNEPFWWCEFWGQMTENSQVQDETVFNRA